MFKFIDSIDFIKDKESICATMPQEEEFLLKSNNIPKNISEEIKHLYRYPLLTKEQEIHLFRKMNYLKKLYNQTLDESVKLEVELTRNRLIECNLRLAFSIAKKFFTKQPYQKFREEIISECYLLITKSIDKFDYTKGNKFITYATGNLIKAIYKIYHKKTKDRLKQIKEDNKFLFIVNEDNYTRLNQDEAKNILFETIRRLDPRSKKVIFARYGIDEPRKEFRTLSEELGISKERVRQIEVAAINKIKKIIELEKKLSEQDILAG